MKIARYYGENDEQAAEHARLAADEREHAYERDAWLTADDDNEKDLIALENEDI